MPAGTNTLAAVTLRTRQTGGCGGAPAWHRTSWLRRWRPPSAPAPGRAQGSGSACTSGAPAAPGLTLQELFSLPGALKAAFQKPVSADSSEIRR